MKQFDTTFRFTDRESKSKYVWLKYRSILEGRSILDVGADECHLKKYLGEGAAYWGVGLGGNPNQELDLEGGKLPFADDSYDCVLCLDVLEHLEKIHAVFDELCRVTRRHVVISLPSPLATLVDNLHRGPYREDRVTKFYGLPTEPPEDRHRWFFGFGEAERFVRQRAAMNGMSIVQIDAQGKYRPPTRFKRWLLRSLSSPEIDEKDLYNGPLWAVLEKNARE